MKQKWKFTFFLLFRVKIRRKSNKKITKRKYAAYSFAIRTLLTSPRYSMHFTDEFSFYFPFSQSDNHRILSSLAFAFIIVVIGFPMWWKTTEVYRVPLPYDLINALDHEPIQITSKIGIFTHSVHRSALLVQELNQMQPKDGKLLSKLVIEWIERFSPLTSGLFKLRIEAINVTADELRGITVPSVLESRLLKQYPLTAGDFVFIEWEKLTEDILLTSERSALISAQTSNCRLLVSISMVNSFNQTQLLFIAYSRFANSSGSNAVDSSWTEITFGTENDIWSTHP